jgi:hypothetical protein
MGGLIKIGTIKELVDLIYGDNEDYILGKIFVEKN